MSISIPNSVAMVLVAYVLAGLAPVLKRQWGPFVAALAPTCGAVLVLLLNPMPGGLVVALVFVTAAVGYAMQEQLASGAMWLAAQAGILVALAVLAAWGEARASALAVVEGLVPVAIVLGGLVITVEWGGAFVGRAIQPFASQLRENGGETEDNASGLPSGFENGGKTIGRWERLLIFLFVLADAATAIGFLVAAKSVLRFGEVKDRSSRRQAEYIIIGTLMSFGFALVAAYLTKLALTLGLPAPL
ncbi:MAG: hypothetical protein AAFQ53_07460 [Bacteroidota bacterium]